MSRDILVGANKIFNINMTQMNSRCFEVLLMKTE